MSDAALRRLEREYRAGDQQAGIAWLRERLRHDTLDRAQLELLAYLRCEPACELLGDDLWWDGLDPWSVRSEEYNVFDGSLGFAGPFVLDPIWVWSEEAWGVARELAQRETGVNLRAFSRPGEPMTQALWNRDLEAVASGLVPWVLDQHGLARSQAPRRAEPMSWSGPLETLSMDASSEEWSSADVSGLDAARLSVAALLGHRGAQRASQRSSPEDDVTWARALAAEAPVASVRAVLAIAWHRLPAWWKLMPKRDARPVRSLALAEACLADPSDARRASARLAAERPIGLDAALRPLEKEIDKPFDLSVRWWARFAERTARWAAAAAADPERAGELLVRCFTHAAPLRERWGFPLVDTIELHGAVEHQVLPWALGLPVPEPAARKKVPSRLLEPEVEETERSGSKAARAKRAPTRTKAAAPARRAKGTDPAD